MTVDELQGLHSILTDIITRTRGAAEERGKVSSRRRWGARHADGPWRLAPAGAGQRGIFMTTAGRDGWQRIRGGAKGTRTPNPLLANESWSASDASEDSS